MSTERAGPALFISYARRQPDEDWVARIAEILHHRYGVTVRFDKRHITPGRSFDEEIKSLIRTSDGVIFIGSASSVTSDPCREECAYARNQGKPVIPLFIEDVSWGDFPFEFHSLHFEQLQRATTDNQFAAMVGKGLLAAGLEIDPAAVPKPEAEFDVWAEYVHPPYGNIRQASTHVLRDYVEECSRRLQLNPRHGFHNLNLALLFLRLRDQRRAAEYVHIALGDLPGRADAHYFEALIAAAATPLASMPRARAERIVRSLDNALHLGIEALPKDRSVGAALPWLLKAIVAHDYYTRNGLISSAGDAELLLHEATQRSADGQELDRLSDALSGLSEWGRRAIEACRNVSQGAGNAVSAA